MDLLLFIFAGCVCILFVYFVCKKKKKRIYNLLACLLLPIKMKEWGACKMIEEEEKKRLIGCEKKTKKNLRERNRG